MARRPPATNAHAPDLDRAALARGGEQIKIVLARRHFRSAKDVISVAISHAWLGDVRDFQLTKLL